MSPEELGKDPAVREELAFLRIAAGEWTLSGDDRRRSIWTRCRCAGTTKAGVQCKRDATWRDHCWMHLPEDHKREYEQYKEKSDLYWSVLLMAPLEVACWSWPVPERTYIPNVGDEPEDRARAAMKVWHAGRCAICGEDGHVLIEDHDHNTGMTRGFLCRSCNTREGVSRGWVWRAYREFHPAHILSMRIRYIERSGLAAESINTEPDRREDNPMRGVL